MSDFVVKLRKDAVCEVHFAFKQPVSKTHLDLATSSTSKYQFHFDAFQCPTSRFKSFASGVSCRFQFTLFN